MTTIAIDREVLEQAAALLNPDRSPSALFHQRRDCAEAIRAALSAPATAPDELERLRKDAERRPMTDEEIQSAWDMAVGPYGHIAGLYKRGIARAVEAFHGIKGTP